MRWTTAPSGSRTIASAARQRSTLMRACAANGVYRSNPLERIFRDMHVARGHIANNTDHFARLHGAVMLGLENTDPFV